ncbi:hypothetical protein RHMOL_Rhmol03G0151800 [Rhododendron molle]|uniref:Uncharacterized protein n=1 Tax=Rhododendron molle TaxID=49168 RepID=A0ACC0PE86_RHOML|nr:hypothetical protein RHMOL_Rhmol03G0151800 [Rhododendron molle]
MEKQMLQADKKNMEREISDLRRDNQVLRKEVEELTRDNEKLGKKFQSIGLTLKETWKNKCCHEHGYLHSGTRNGIDMFFCVCFLVGACWGTELV